MREAEYVMQQPAKSDRVLALARKFPIVRTRATLKASGPETLSQRASAKPRSPGDWTSVRRIREAKQ
jgi:hypothetical protein